MNFSLFCFEEEQAICLGCNSVEAVAAMNDADPIPELGRKRTAKSLHEGHYVKSIKQVLQQANKDKARLKNELKDQETKITTAITYFSGLEEMFTEQRDLLMKKLNADFEVILKMVEKRRAEMTHQIKNTYNGMLEQAVSLKEGLQALYETITKIKNAEIRVDID